MEPVQNSIELHSHFEPDTQAFLEDLVSGLSQTAKSLPSKYFYDRRGAELFDQICDLDEYYPTRTELAIMERYAGDIAEVLGPDCLLVEYGSGSSLKTRLLLDNLESLAAYLPLDISRDYLESSADLLAEQYRDIAIHPVIADFTEHFHLPEATPKADRTVVYFPGSTLGNFTIETAEELLAQVVDVCGENGGLLIGLDLQKDIDVLERAYNDQFGVTADFNLNVLTRSNRELGSNFDLEQFQHEAFYNKRESRIEMHLRSCADQTVAVDGQEFAFEEGETICTEYSHKYCLDDFSALAAKVGLKTQRIWTDDRQWFGVLWLTVERASTCV